MRPCVLLLSLAACGVSTVERPQVAFEIHRVDVGFGSADVLALDWDGDGALDLAVSGEDRIAVLRGDGSGRFRASGTVAAGENPVHLASGDLDEDGRVDLVVANHETDYLTLVLGGGEEVASSRSRRLPLDVSPHPHAVAVRDVDGDGHLDLLVDDRDRERLQVHLGRGDGSFEIGEAIAVGGDPYRGMTVSDIDGDGHLDVLTPNPLSVSIQLGDGRGGFARGAELASSEMPPFSTAAGDFDGDGVVDVAAGSGESRGELRIWLGRGAGGFAPAPDSPYRIAEGPTAMTASDVNGDGVDDIVVASYVGNGLALVLGGSAADVIRIELEDYPWNVTAGDLDQDGLVDLAVTHGSGTEITLLLQRPAGSHPSREEAEPVSNSPPPDRWPSPELELDVVGAADVDAYRASVQDYVPEQTRADYLSALDHERRPGVLPGYDRVFVGIDGYLRAQVYESDLAPPRAWDVYDGERRFVGRVHVWSGLHPMAITREALVGVRRDTLGVGTCGRVGWIGGRTTGRASRPRGEDLTVELIQLALHEPPGILHRLVVDGRSERPDDEVEDLLNSKAIELLVELPEVESFQLEEKLLSTLVGEGDAHSTDLRSGLIDRRLIAVFRAVRSSRGPLPQLGRGAGDPWSNQWWAKASRARSRAGIGRPRQPR